MGSIISPIVNFEHGLAGEFALQRFASTKYVIVQRTNIQ